MTDAPMLGRVEHGYAMSRCTFICRFLVTCVFSNGSIALKLDRVQAAVSSRYECWCNSIIYKQEF
jgi:hypothetical protein